MPGILGVKVGQELRVQELVSLVNNLQVTFLYGFRYIIKL